MSDEGGRWCDERHREGEYLCDRHHPERRGLADAPWVPLRRLPVSTLVQVDAVGGRLDCLVEIEAVGFLGAGIST